MPVPQSWNDLSVTPGNNSPQGSEIVGPYANDYFQAAFAFLKQLYTQGGLPTQALNANSQQVHNVAAGTALTDAVNLQQLNTVLGAPSGTRCVFQQAAAPTGWTVDGSAQFTDCSMRFNQGVSSSMGNTTWSGWNFGGQFTDNAHAITQNEMPSHSHTDSGHNHGFGDPGHNHGFNDPGHSHGFNKNASSQAGSDNGGMPASTDQPYYSTGRNFLNVNASGTGCWLNASGTGCYINPSNANIQATGGGAGHQHTYTTPQVRFADCIVGIKS